MLQKTIIQNLKCEVSFFVDQNKNLGFG